MALGLDAGSAPWRWRRAPLGGTNQSWIDGSGEWLVEVAVAARAGVEAARLAAAGVAGAAGAFEGPAGWSRAFFGDEGGRRCSGSGAVGRAHRGRRDKPYPVSGIAQVPTSSRSRPAIELNTYAPPSGSSSECRPTSSLTRNGQPWPVIRRSDSLMSVVRCVALAYLYGRDPEPAWLVDAPTADERVVLDVPFELVADSDLDEELRRCSP